MAVSPATRRLMQARIDLLLDNRHAFFGSLAMHLNFVERSDLQFKTAATDGTNLLYDPDFIMGLSDDEVMFILVHETCHCALGHIWRRGDRHPLLANIAMDYAVNVMLDEAGFKMVKGGLLDHKYKGRSWEWIYDRLPVVKIDIDKLSQAGPGAGGSDVLPPPKDGSGDGDGEGDGSDKKGATAGAGDDDQDGSGHRMTEEDWRQAVEIASKCVKQGHGAFNADRLVAMTKPKVDWRTVLRKFVQQNAKDDFSFKKINHRYLHTGFYFPSLHSEAMPAVLVFGDTSGSIDDLTLSKFIAEVNSVVDDCKPEAVHLGWVDAKVHNFETFYRGDLPTYRPKGGGGTDFRPAFDMLRNGDERLSPVPCCVIYLTDLYGTFPDYTPSVPVLWVVPNSPYGGYGGRPVPPFGEVVEVD